MSSLPLVQAESVTVYFGNNIVFKNFSASILPGMHTALIGENGSGKSTLLKLFAGESRLSQIPLEGSEGNGRILWNVNGCAETSALMGKAHVRLFSPAQQNAYIRQGWRISGEEIILSGFANTPLLYSPASQAEKDHIRKLAGQAEIEHLLPMLAPDMSQGQLRAVLILRAIASRPKLLLLDEPLEGLDASARFPLLSLMDMAANEGCTLLVTAHRKEDVPLCIQQFCAISPSGLFPLQQYPEQQLTGGGEYRQKLFDCLFSPATVNNTRAQRSCPDSCGTSVSPPSSVPLIALDNVDVYIDRVQVLKGVTWHIHQGQQWLVSGENGSGKSTLLRLLHGEEFAAWGGSLAWFGQRPIPLARLQKDVGYVSDRLHSLYTYDMSAHDVVLSGADGSIGLYRDLTDDELARARRLMQYFDLEPFAHTPFHSLSSGQGRRVLLARALVGAPKVLLLDEPFSGLDAQNRALWLQLLPILTSCGITIIFVSHHEAEYGNVFTHQLTLADGRIKAQHQLR